jgi:hypothetical protein
MFNEYHEKDDLLSVIPNELRDSIKRMDFDATISLPGHKERVRKIAITGSGSELFSEITAVNDAVRTLTLNLEVDGIYPTDPSPRDEEDLSRRYNEHYSGALALLIIVGVGQPHPEVPNGIVRSEHSYMEFFYRQAISYGIPVRIFLSLASPWPRRDKETDLIQQLRAMFRAEQICFEFHSVDVLVRQAIEAIYSIFDRGHYEFDVALSFAGKDRSVVREIARALEERGIRVFYDEKYTHRLWGKDLAKFLGEVYENLARYCVIISSRHYNFSSWTRHERQHAQARQLREPGEYILQLRLDDTSIPGIPATIAYADFKNADSAARLIEAKLIDGNT